MKQKINLLCLLTLISIVFISLSSCKKDNFENSKTIRQLYGIYRNGEISECQLNSQTVYCASQNVFDAATLIYDKDGAQIGVCNYAMNNVDSICSQLSDCEVIYRVENSIWGLPAVDKYGLGN